MRVRKKTFVGKLENLETIGKYVLSAAKSAGLNEMATYAVQLAVDEAATNIIEHSYGGDGRGLIELSYQIYENGLKVVLRDFGEPFEPDSIPEPELNVSLDQLKPRGLGIFFIKKMMDEVHYEFSTRNGNTITMFKRKDS